MSNSKNIAYDSMLLEDFLKSPTIANNQVWLSMPNREYKEHYYLNLLKVIRPDQLNQIVFENHSSSLHFPSIDDADFRHNTLQNQSVCFRSSNGTLFHHNVNFIVQSESIRYLHHFVSKFINELCKKHNNLFEIKSIIKNLKRFNPKTHRYSKLNKQQLKTLQSHVVQDIIYFNFLRFIENNTYLLINCGYTDYSPQFLTTAQLPTHSHNFGHSSAREDDSYPQRQLIEDFFNKKIEKILVKEMSFLVEEEQKRIEDNISQTGTTFTYRSGVIIIFPETKIETTRLLLSVDGLQMLDTQQWFDQTTSVFDQIF